MAPLDAFSIGFGFRAGALFIEQSDPQPAKMGCCSSHGRTANKYGSRAKSDLNRWTSHFNLCLLSRLLHSFLISPSRR
jgi:hypothetical protein